MGYTEKNAVSYGGASSIERDPIHFECKAFAIDSSLMLRTRNFNRKTRLLMLIKMRSDTPPSACYAHFFLHKVNRPICTFL